MIQLVVVLAALYMGSRYGSLALGAIAGIGLAILVLGFGMAPGVPPTDVIYIIIAAVTCAGALQASGGMEWMIQLAEKMLRRHPGHITFLAPLSTFLLTVLVGTGHVVYTLMPIIADIALKQKIRPERPCAIASIASQLGITCSPIAAAVVAMVSISNLNGFDIAIPHVLAVTIPATLCGMAMAAAISYKRGPELVDDPEYRRRLADPELRRQMEEASATTLNSIIRPESKRAVYIFLGALAVIVVYACFPALLPSFEKVRAIAGASSVSIGGAELSAAQIAASGVIIPGVTETYSSHLSMGLVIQIVMITAASLIFMFCKSSPKKAVQGAVWQNGMTAVVAIYGIAWLADTYFAHWMPAIKDTLGALLMSYSWLLALVFFTVSVLVNSQGAVVVSMVPMAYAMGVPGWVILGVFPSIYGYFFIPTYPSDIATVNFDRTGTTKIGKYLLNHSFMLPGMVCVIVSTIVSYVIASLFFK
ncbi:MAG: anaerobic C4-dicarboxylate transporter [Alloprevotella sp.]|nr:anaerobic C4-dicarboxylate transporter [Alloprevotella sp.]